MSKLHRDISEIWRFRCGGCQREIEVYTSARNKEVNVACCESLMHLMSKDRPKVALDVFLSEVR